MLGQSFIQIYNGRMFYKSTSMTQKKYDKVTHPIGFATYFCQSLVKILRIHKNTL